LTAIILGYFENFSTSIILRVSERLKFGGGTGFSNDRPGAPDPQSGYLQSRGNHEQHHGADDRRQVSAHLPVVERHRLDRRRRETPRAGIEFESATLRDYIRTA
jgi:hypothetical protein